MGFRQRTDLKHKAFLRLHRERLIQIGIPLRTMESDAWRYLLDHGDCCYTKWNIDGLDTQQLLSLLELVDNYEEYNESYSPPLRQQIKYKLENK